MRDILHEIVDNIRIKISADKQAVPLAELERQVMQAPIKLRRSMSNAIAASSTGIIAEFKRKSPSKGWINKDAKPEVVIPTYADSGAAALSILTNEQYFGGELNYIQIARTLVNIPILRKEFIVDEYQIYQAYLAGADAILLIAASLSIEQCKKLTIKAHELQIEVLLEIHSKDELCYFDEVRPDMLGVNNRHLGTFHTNPEHSLLIAPLLPRDTVLVSESGISDAAIIHKLRQAGFRGFLIGETFMRTSDPGRALKEFSQAICCS